MKRTSRNLLVIFLPMIVWALVIVTSLSVNAADIVTFKSTDTLTAGTPLMLTGKLTRPQGDGPFPAIVLLHGCNGIRPNQDVWAKRFADWGYVAFQVDSLGPRGFSDICADVGLVGINQRTQDTYDAKTYLSGLPFVDRNRIGVLGWSHGGITTLSVVDQKRDDPFRSAIAFYPFCNRLLSEFNAPLLILIGDKDLWTPSATCSTKMRPGQAGHEVILKIYPDATHGFDAEGADLFIEGHRILYNPAAAADAIIQVKEFLTKHLK
jgi:dienelactone hydrolase